MGEYADMLIDGTCDFYTGEYIGEGPGYPRTLRNKPKMHKKGEMTQCAICKKWVKKAGLIDHTKAKH